MKIESYQKKPIQLGQLKDSVDKNNFLYFNQWVKEFFKREVLRSENSLNDYTENPLFGSAMREEVSYWNPNRSKHAEVYWLENYVFNKDSSVRNKILNAMVVKFVGMPTLTLVATDSLDYSNIIDFDLYDSDGNYFKFVNNNLNENKMNLSVWGKTQLQTSLQTAARNYCREKYKNPERRFHLSDMIEWIVYLDKLGLSRVVTDSKNKLSDVCEWLIQHRGIGPYFGYHPPCNFSRYDKLSHIDEDDNYCLIGPGAKRGLEFVFPDIKMTNNNIMENLILSIRDNQYEFFEFANDGEFYFYRKNLERSEKLTTFGTEITFCQFNCFDGIKDDPKAQYRRILPLTFEPFYDIINERNYQRLF